MVTIRTIDVPQADALATVRQVIEALSASSVVSTSTLVEKTGFSDRHVRYRVATARVLELITDGDKGPTLTVRGRKLLRTRVGSASEKQQLRKAVENCRIVREIVPDLFSASRFNFDEIAKKIMARVGLSKATAERRAQVLRAWRRQLS